MRIPLLLLLSWLLSACSTLPQVSGGLPGREEIRAFALDARFSLKVERFGEAAQSASGRLSWEHQNDRDRLFLANPLGTGLAEVEMASGGATLRSGNGDVREHASADVLVQQLTGYALPVSRLSHWLLGRSASNGEVRRDALGRPLVLWEAGWRVEYDYPDNSVTTLPHILRVNRASEVMLVLRIEAWQEVP